MQCGSYGQLAAYSWPVQWRRTRCTVTWRWKWWGAGGPARGEGLLEFDGGGGAAFCVWGAESKGRRERSSDVENKISIIYLYLY
jgi:hypothetical protein